MSEPIIQLVDLTKQYGEQTAVDRLNLSIYPGEVYGLLGPNGAGKSTTILMMLGLAEPTSGTVTVCGANSTRDPIQVKRKVGYMPDDVGFYEDMTGLENLLYTGRLNGLSRQEAMDRAKRLLERVGLSDAAEKKAGTYSRGMRQRLGLGEVLIKQPEVIILDEPTLGIDPEGVREFLQLIQQLSRDEGITVLLSSHHLHQVQQICDRVGLFVAGRLLAEGDIHSLSQQLFQEEAIVIEVEAEPVTEQLMESLRQIEGVGRIEGDERRFVISCTKDVTTQISRTIVNQGCALLQLAQKEYGLDEIYHRYFEGREAR
ncbi:ABC transporter ATP-binding protein [Brevibacillus sp. TJ4]|uniref:ABC transporter ATP-binding protein n=1 Tax=Brevibacillus sp. TJ4 TaxID=3234853 RepID=UPI003B9FDEDE